MSWMCLYVQEVNFLGDDLPRVARRDEIKDDRNPWSPENKFEVIWSSRWLPIRVFCYYKENPIPKLPTVWWSCCGEREIWQMRINEQIANKALVSA
jgi:hypothetical protein